MTAYTMLCAALAHLETMERQCYSENVGTYAYRSPDGEKCLIGALIPDQVYRPVLEGYEAGHIAEHLYKALIPEDMQRIETDLRAIPGGMYRAQGVVFLNRLQEAHDAAEGEGEAFRESVRASIRRLCDWLDEPYPSKEEIEAARGLTV